MPRKPLAERLSRYTVDEETGCWNWTSKKDQRGYGVLLVEGKYRNTHRLSHELHRGAIPVGMFVCHRCDNPSCMNPDHLFLGTHADNMRDKVSKGRQSRVPGGSMHGEKNGSCKLSEAEVIEILNAKGVTQTALAEKYGVSSGQISKIQRGVKWSALSSALRLNREAPKSA
jgi:hypothetical protein